MPDAVVKAEGLYRLHFTKPKRSQGRQNSPEPSGETRRDKDEDGVGCWCKETFQN